MKHTYHPVNKVRNEVVTIHIRYYSEMDFYIEEFLPDFYNSSFSGKRSINATNLQCMLKISLLRWTIQRNVTEKKATPSISVCLLLLQQVRHIPFLSLEVSKLLFFSVFIICYYQIMKESSTCWQLAGVEKGVLKNRITTFVSHQI